MPSSNPALNARTFQGIYAREVGGEQMTLDGTVMKAGLLLICVALTALFSWIEITNYGLVVFYPLMMVGFLGGMILAVVTILRKQWAGITGPLYALFEGLGLGAFSYIFEIGFPGIILQATLLTFGVAAAMFLAYKTRLIQPTQNFRLGVFAATGGIMIFYLLSVVMSLFGLRAPLIWDNGPFGILFSMFVVGIAALNLVIDFDFIEQGANRGAPKYMEWYAAFGLMVTLIWLYIEILRLLAKSRSR
jgi:uncharacterized YccA/Bax inhibitor family protein